MHTFRTKNKHQPIIIETKSFKCENDVTAKTLSPDGMKCMLQQFCFGFYFTFPSEIQAKIEPHKFLCNRIINSQPLMFIYNICIILCILYVYKYLSMEFITFLGMFFPCFCVQCTRRRVMRKKNRNEILLFLMKCNSYDPSDYDNWEKWKWLWGSRTFDTQQRERWSSHSGVGV